MFDCLFILSILVCFIKCNLKSKYECSCTCSKEDMSHLSSGSAVVFTICWHSNDPGKVQCADILYHWLPRLINRDDYIFRVGVAPRQTYVVSTFMWLNTYTRVGIAVGTNSVVRTKCLNVQPSYCYAEYTSTYACGLHGLVAFVVHCILHILFVYSVTVATLGVS